MNTKILFPISLADGNKSISDDDICSICGHCKFNPGELSQCLNEWPGKVDESGYIQECPQFLQIE